MKLYLITVLCLSLETGVQSSRSQSSIYKKDMSEYCRRQVMMSVFLGRHVPEANSQILHFSQLEVPYSCTISIRTEPGSNIVMVLETKNMTEACDRKSGNRASQVLVYEIGETFGGYWAALPNEIMHNTPSTNARFYTLATTSETPSKSKSTVGQESSSETDTDVKLNKVITGTGDTRTGPNPKDYVEVEVPLVKVSGVLVDSADVPPKKYEDDDKFDAIYDVAPRPGEEFSSRTILPLVQYSIHREDSRPRFEEAATNVTVVKSSVFDEESSDDTGIGSSTEPDDPRYAIDYEVFTPDPRFKYPFLERILSGKGNRVHRKGQKFNANKILKFRKTNGPSINRRKNLFQTVYTEETVHKIWNKNITNYLKTTPTADESKFMDELINALKQSHIENNTNKSQLLENISNMHHNFSVYLAPNISMYNIKRTSSETENDRWTGMNVSTSTLTTQVQALITKSKVKKPAVYEINSTAGEQDESSLNIVTEIKFQTTVESNTGRKTTKNHLKSTSKTHPVDSITSVNTTPDKTTRTMDSLGPAAMKHTIKLQKSTPNIGKLKKRRRKRIIQAIDVELARPHSVSQAEPQSHIPKPEDYLTLMQDFTRMLELQDDEVHGRVALSHVNNYLGNMLLNVCDTPVQKSSQVFLFNTSRILLVLNHFTVERMTLVVTPARIISSQESSCPEMYLECQVSGARVCIDSMCACDGVANCGSYDVYDEDRLLCSKDLGGQQSVYLAAFAFLAVLFTALYTVHYWLRRCVPKVSDAFFVYTDGTENILYLDSIMRSPADLHDESLYNSHLFPGDIMMDDLQSDTKEISKMDRFKSLFPCYRKKGRVSIELKTLDQIHPELVSTISQQRRQDAFSFGGSEIIKFSHIVHDEITQTEGSLDIQTLEEETEKGIREDRIKYTTHEVHVSTPKDDEQSRDSELSVLKFMRMARGTPGRKNSTTHDVAPNDLSRTRQYSQSASIGKEREIQSTFYADSLSSYNNPEEDSIIKPGTSAQAKKHLRFDNNLTTIPSDDDVEGNSKPGHGGLQGIGKPTDPEDVKVQEYSAARDFKRFWSGNKGIKKKKEEPKKKNQSSLR